MITLKTRRLLLDPWREEDAEALYLSLIHI